MKLSDATLCAELALRLRGARVFQLFARKLGPRDVTYVSALAFGPGGNVIEAKASSMELSRALVLLLSNLDQATDMHDAEQDGKHEEDEDEDDADEAAIPAQVVQVVPARAPRPARPPTAADAARIAHRRETALRLVASTGAVSARTLARAAPCGESAAQKTIAELGQTGVLQRDSAREGKNRGYVAGPRFVPPATDVPRG